MSFLREGDNEPAKPGLRPDSNGEPSVSFNRLSLNMYIYDVPKSPDVAITMSYNSQDSTNLHRVFGNKKTVTSWVYGSKLALLKKNFTGSCLKFCCF